MISFLVKETTELKQNDLERAKELEVLRKFRDDTLRGVKVRFIMPGLIS